ncbi:MAG: MAPEG family protein [Gammaproteobacteria bacterium]
MNNVQLIFPMLALVLLTCAVAVTMLRRRIAAARSKKVQIKEFAVNQFNDEAPLNMLQAGRNYANLFEMTTIFYAVCVATMAVNLTDTVMVVLAWLYVAARYLHSYIHLGANRIVHRLRAFALSMFVVLGMWIWLGLRAGGVV